MGWHESTRRCQVIQQSPKPPKALNKVFFVILDKEQYDTHEWLTVCKIVEGEMQSMACVAASVSTFLEGHDRDTWPHSLQRWQDDGLEAMSSVTCNDCAEYNVQRTQGKSREGQFLSAATGTAHHGSFMHSTSDQHPTSKVATYGSARREAVLGLQSHAPRHSTSARHGTICDLSLPGAKDSST